MFGGIVQSVGRIVKLRPFKVDAGALDLSDVKVGDSVCVQGACLTVTAKRGKRLSFDVSRETLACTTGLDRLGPVNLEKSLRLGDPLGGHLVAGHVDGVGKVLNRRGGVVRFRVPEELSRYLARKGSVCVDGVSLTVNWVVGDTFQANLIPHTLERTTLARLARRARVNLEVDLIARYVERMLPGNGASRR